MRKNVRQNGCKISQGKGYFNPPPPPSYFKINKVFALYCRNITDKTRMLTKLITVGFFLAQQFNQ